ncbi:hypothetical protein JRO89_XS01G0010100 [Xanthoceras sorbifolium]|uniref:Remorin N-terminal domain-containing protein n=1 Tax=Xanthoceras sorbifolium TaxID=99658 RepID=A0ABQ8IHS7_9ROSI|nr:hypothetical protein JRO89_XS01G0010100 [Xanthoceras sorbifolium]
MSLEVCCFKKLEILVGLDALFRLQLHGPLLDFNVLEISATGLKNWEPSTVDGLKSCAIRVACPSLVYLQCKASSTSDFTFQDMNCLQNAEIYLKNPPDHASVDIVILTTLADAELENFSTSFNNLKTLWFFVGMNKWCIKIPVPAKNVIVEQKPLVQTHEEKKPEESKALVIVDKAPDSAEKKTSGGSYDRASIHKDAEVKRAMVEAKRAEQVLKAEEMAAKYPATNTTPKKLLGCFSSRKFFGHVLKFTYVYLLSLLCLFAVLFVNHSAMELEQMLRVE